MSGYDNIILAEPTLVHFYKMDEASGVIFDYKGNLDSVSSGGPANSVTFNVIAIFDDCETCVSADGTDAQGVGFNNNFGNDHNFTYEFEVEFVSFGATDKNAVRNGASPSGGDQQIYIKTTGHIQYSSLDDSLNVVSSSALSLNTPYHIAITYNSSGIAFYINGVLDSYTLCNITSFPHLPIASIMTNRDYINPSLYTSTIDGKMAKFAYYNSALSSGSIATHYSSRFICIPPLVDIVLSLVSFNSYEVSLAWTSASGGVPPYTYEVQFSNFSNFSVYSVKITGLSSLSYIDNTVIQGLGYYRVKVTDSYDESLYSNYISVIIPSIQYNGFSGWGNIPNKLVNGDFYQNHRFLGINEALKFNQTNNTSERDLSSLILRCKYLEGFSEYTTVISNVSAQIISVQSIRFQLLWKSQGI